jgi:AcrR family transcriptional regulator
MPPPARRRPSSTHDLAAVVRLDRVNAPKQARSTESMQRILAALEKLLETKPFDAITISDIEAYSGCGIATIYARFKDKNSILAALHESLRDKLIARIDEQTDLARWADASLEHATYAICRGLVAFHSRNRNLMRAVLVLDDREVYQRAADIIRHAVTRIQAVVVHCAGIDADAFARELDVGIRAAYALLHQRLLFLPISPGRSMADERAFAADLALVIRCCVGRA